MPRSSGYSPRWPRAVLLHRPLDRQDQTAPLRPSEPREATDRLLPAVLYRLGRTQVEVRDWQAAAVTLDRLVAEFPASPYRQEARVLRAEAALNLGDADAADSGFAALLAEPERPGDAPGLRRSVRLEQVRCWVVLKKWKDLFSAIQALRGELKPDDPALAELDYALGQARMGLGRMEEARTAFQAVIDARRGSELAAQAQLMRGETLFHEGRLREALRRIPPGGHSVSGPAMAGRRAARGRKGAHERLDQWGRRRRNL